MMKMQIANEGDRKEAQNRERRRQCELERRNRIFNARARKIGVSLLRDWFTYNNLNTYSTDTIRN